MFVLVITTQRQYIAMKLFQTEICFLIRLYRISVYGFSNWLICPDNVQHRLLRCINAENIFRKNERKRQCIIITCVLIITISVPIIRVLDVITPQQKLI